MVEGPGCTLNGEKIRTRVQKGQKVSDIRETAVSTSKNDSSTGSFQCFIGCEYTGVETLGKELFIYFGSRALRVHFGMNGSMRINPTERKDRRGGPPVMVVRLTKDVICFFDSTIEIRLSEDCEQKVKLLGSLDVCSPEFSFSRAVETVRRETSRMLCDVLLDQAVLPGVGNIIKNEALFDSGLHPAVKVNQLSNEQVHHLIKMTRDFTLLFYKCRKSGSPLYKHYKVYKRPDCGQCSGPITVCRLGDNARMTYFCQRCQTGDPSEVNISKLPTRNTLVGWVCQGRVGDTDHVANREEEEWACNLCTLINLSRNKSCDACLSPRPERPKELKETEASLFTRDLILYPCNAFSKPQKEVKMNRRTVFGTTTLVLTDLSRGSSNTPCATENQTNPPNTVRAFNPSPVSAISRIQNKSADFQKRDFPSPYTQPSKKMKTDYASLSSGPVSHPTTPSCMSHRQPAVLRVVTKDGENKGRHFYACSLPREKQCNFFEWADLHFPLCNHGKRTLMRTVLKLGPNNGRNFYVCPFKMGKQCDFFQWVENGPGIRILPGC
ncbi:endonuclease 8-like 3 [Chanos chanos]|uniref:Endonuclease 8-like 3 n=1 Tax=Chanos chanos TaxID=29144 RepID=A0A6J2WJ40_CHACN|nr:endonuclease 8-like 3 [Chanos chanos]